MVPNKIIVIVKIAKLGHKRKTRFEEIIKLWNTFSLLNLFYVAMTFSTHRVKNFIKTIVLDSFAVYKIVDTKFQIIWVFHIAFILDGIELRKHYILLLRIVEKAKIKQNH